MRVRESSWRANGHGIELAESRVHGTAQPPALRFRAPQSRRAESTSTGKPNLAFCAADGTPKPCVLTHRCISSTDKISGELGRRGQLRQLPLARIDSPRRRVPSQSAGLLLKDSATVVLSAGLCRRRRRASFRLATVPARAHYLQTPLARAMVGAPRRPARNRLPQPVPLCAGAPGAHAGSRLAPLQLQPENPGDRGRDTARAGRQSPLPDQQHRLLRVLAGQHPRPCGRSTLCPTKLSTVASECLIDVEARIR